MSHTTSLVKNIWKLLTMASSAIANNYGPNTIQLEGAAAVSAAKEREAKNALQASNIQHAKELRVNCYLFLIGH